MTSRDIECGISKSDLLGRDVTSSKLYKRIKKGRKIPEIFMDNRSPLALSVNRLTPKQHQEPPANHPYLVSDKMLADISDLRAEMLGKNFYCWAELTVGNVEKSGRKVYATPSDDNKSHADIILPDEAKDDINIRKHHALQLAFYAKFRPHPVKEPIYAAAFSGGS